MLTDLIHNPGLLQFEWIMILLPNQKVEKCPGKCLMRISGKYRPQFPINLRKIGENRI